MRRTWKLGVGTLGVVLLLSACSSSEPEAGGESAEPVVEEPSEGESTDEGAPSETSEPAAQAGGTLAIAHRTGTASWDVAGTRGAPDTTVVGLVYERLIDQDKEGNLVPGLADSWEFNEDATELTLTLAEGVTFTDGTALDAEGVVKNLERARTLPTSTIASAFANVASVEATDDMTVLVTQSEPDAGLLETLSDRYGMIMSPATFEVDSESPSEIVGSGAFILVEDEPGIGYTLEANPDYRDADEILLDAVEIQVIGDASTRLSAVRDGLVDIAQVDAGQIEEAESAGLEVVEARQVSSRAIWVNTEAIPELQDENVRLALNLAIDRQSIVDQLAFGHGDIATQLLPPGHAGHNPDITDAWDFDPEQASTLLSEAGLGDGFSFEFAVQPPFSREAEAIQAMWREIGVETELTLIEGFELGQAVWTDRTVGSGMATLSRPPFVAFVSNFGVGGALNPSGLEDPEVLDHLDQARQATDQETQMEIFQELSAYLVEHPQGTWPIFFPYDGLVFDPGVSGVESWFEGFPHLEGVTVAEG